MQFSFYGHYNINYNIVLNSVLLEFYQKKKRNSKPLYIKCLQIIVVATFGNFVASAYKTGQTLIGPCNTRHSVLGT
jgi:hypothetical protein